MANNLSLFNTTYGNSYKVSIRSSLQVLTNFQCKNTDYVNVTDWQLTLSDVKLQPFNITSDGMYGTIEDCSADTKDDWLVPGKLALFYVLL